jgi:hypothetical protein
MKSTPSNHGARRELTHRYVIRVPYSGSEWAIYGEQARQATETVSGMTYSEFCAIELLRDNNWTAAPGIRTSEAIIQGDDSMFIPGGFLHYILMEKARGVQLSEEIFWAYPHSERDRIREGYKAAWRYVMLYLAKCLA